jgi:hypothetical protein
MRDDDLDYEFDVRGFVVLRSVLPPDQVQLLNQLLDQDGRIEQLLSAGSPAEHQLHPRSAFLTWSPAFRQLLDHPIVLPHLERWVEPGLRLDHCYGIFSKPGERQLPLHHGGTPFLYFASYAAREGRIFSGPTVVSWALTDMPKGSGTFTCIPGSHKAALHCRTDVRRFERAPDYVDEVPLQAGDVLIFTEALTHGARRWTCPYPRRSLFFKYSPGCLAWSNDCWPPSLHEMMTEPQRRLCRPPYMHDVTARGPGFRTAVRDEGRVPLLEWVRPAEER